MGDLRKSSVFFIMWLSFFSMAGCTTTSTHRGGLFINQDEFNPDPADKTVLLWEREQNRPVDRPYTKIIIDPLLLLFQPGGELQVVHPDEMMEMAALFRAELALKLGVDYQLVDRVGKDVLRVRIAITDLIPASHPKVALQGTSAPFAVDVSTAIMEVEILDSKSSKRLVALIAKGSDAMGSPMSQDQEKKAQVERAFRKWAGDIRRGLDRACRP
jgi:hypothetical protein